MDDPNQSSDPFKEIKLPDGSNPIEKGIIRRVRELNGAITIEIAIGGIGENLAERIVEQIRGAALTLPQAEHVHIKPIRHEEKDIELRQIDHVIAVASAKGGVGKTTVSVLLARALDVRGLNVGLFDADIYGPNIPHLLNIEGPILTNETGQAIPLDADGIQILSPGVAGGKVPTARRGVIAYGAIQNLLAQGDWDELDVLLVDLPAGSDDVVGAALEHIPIDGAIFVTTPFEASVDDTSRTIELFKENGVPPVAAVVNMNRFTCECCGEPSTLFDDPVELTVPVIHELPFDRQLQRDPGREGDCKEVADLAGTVYTFITELNNEIPNEAYDLRGLPPASQARQLADDLAAINPGETVTAVVGDPSWIEDALQVTAGNIVGEVCHSQSRTTTGALIELSRV